MCGVRRNAEFPRAKRRLSHGEAPARANLQGRNSQRGWNWAPGEFRTGAPQGRLRLRFSEALRGFKEERGGGGVGDISAPVTGAGIVAWTREKLFP